MAGSGIRAPAGDKHYRNQLVRLADLTVTHDVIAGVTFENCTLVGPAVMPLMGETTFTDCGFDGDPVGLLWHRFSMRTF